MEIYGDSCEWFIYDRTTSDCILFKGSLSELENDCTESGYAVHPTVDHCKVEKLINGNGCYVCSRLFHYVLIQKISYSYFNF